MLSWICGPSSQMLNHQILKYNLLYQTGDLLLYLCFPYLWLKANKNSPLSFKNPTDVYDAAVMPTGRLGSVRQETVMYKTDRYEYVSEDFIGRWVVQLYFWLKWFIEQQIWRFAASLRFLTLWTRFWLNEQMCYFSLICICNF